MKLQIMLLMLQILQITFSTCGKGCLRCGDDNRCILCDTSNGFYYQIESQNCISVDIENCQTYDGFQNCSLCDTDYFFDFQTRECRPVHEDNLDENCTQYGQNQKCLKCQPGYVLDQETCQEVNTTIDDCLEYLNQEKCSQCNQGFTLSLDQRSCITNPDQENCKIFSKITCQNCPQNFLFDQELIKNQYQNEILNQSYLNFNSQINSQDNVQVPVRKTCYQQSIEHCRMYSDGQTCSECYPEFELYDGRCYIPKITQIDNCRLYNIVGNQSVCIECTSEYYLSNQECLERTNQSIENCMKLSKNQDLCEKCNENFDFAFNKKKCLEKIDNCQEHQLNYEQTLLVCLVCKNGYYLINNICIEGTIDNCQEYHQNSNVCEKCLDQYYLKDRECKLNQSLVQNCEVYRNNQPKTCNKCETQFKKLQAQQLCLLGQVSNCKFHNTLNTCSICEDEFRVTNTDTCRSIIQNLTNSSTFSQSKNPPQNTLINDGKGDCESEQMIKGDDCQSVFDYQAQNCQVLNDSIESDDTQEQKCKICKIGSVPYNLKDQYLCLKETELQNISEQKSILIEHCIAYGKIGDDIKCIQCDLNYVLDQELCKNNCSDTQMKINKLFQKDSKKIQYLKQTICVDRIEGSDSLVYDNEYNPTTYELQNGYQYEFDFGQSNNKYKIVEPSQVPGSTTSTDLFLFPMHSKIIQLPTEDQINKCQYYIYNEDFGYLCQACEFKYYSEMIFQDFVIENCHEYSDNDLCNICIDGYKQNQDKTACIKSQINNCIKFESNTGNCLLCDDGYYRNTLTSCTKNTISNCQIKHKFKNACLKCNRDYVEIQDQDGYIVICGDLIDECIEYKLEQDLYQCIKCKKGYYPSTNKLNCLQGTIDRCELYDQTKINFCKYFKNEIEIISKQQCSDMPVIYGCGIYNNDRSQCTQCKVNHKYYENEQLCCDYGTYPNTNDDQTDKCTGTQDNCKTWILNETTYECNQCNTNYLLNLTTKLCMIDNQQDSQTTQSKEISFNNSNTLNCGLYDFNKFQCLGCKAGYYLSQNKCCEFGKYNNNNTCEDISGIDASFSLCQQISDDKSICLKCTDNTQPQDNLCCDLDTQVYSYDNSNNVKCLTIPTNMNCGTFISSQNQTPSLQCQTCTDDTFYLVENNAGCCKKQTSSQSGQYWDSTQNSNAGGCLDVSTEIDNCQTYNSSQECTSCQLVGSDQYQLTLENQCCKTQQVYTMNNCAKISTLYQNCKQINKSNSDFCTECKVDYYESNNVCVANGKYFPIDNNQNFDTPIDQDITTAESSISSNCIQISNDKSQCLKCKKEYRKVPNDNKLCCADNEQYNNSQCESISGSDTSNCNYDIKGNCISCKDGYYFLNNICCADDEFHRDGSCISKSLAKQFCTQFNYTTFQCTLCNSGYYLSNKICCQNGQYLGDDGCVNYPENCQVFDSQQDQCTQCIQNYYLGDDGCVNYPENCQVFDSQQDQCTQCIQNYYLGDDGCVNYPANCQVFDSQQDQCTQCKDDYIRHQGCKKNPEGCLSYDGSKCTRCSYYYHMVDQICEKNPEGCYIHDGSKCTQCSSNYHMEDQICVKNPEGCSKHDGSKCTQCYQYYHMVDQICEKNPEGCLSYDGSKCTRCSPYYHMVDQICEKKVEGCYSYDGSKCTQCKSLTHHMVDQICVKNPEGCDLYNGSKCTSCSPYYHMVDQICVKNPEGCQEYDGSKCTTCSSYDYHMVDQICEKNPKGCSKHDGSKCTECNTYYHMIDQICEKEIEECLSYDGSKCTQCSSYYHLVDQICEENPEGCHTFDGSKCTQCNIYNYHMEDQGCVKKPEGCYIHDGSKCYRCKDDYYLSSANCCTHQQYYDTDLKECVAYTDPLLQYCKKGTKDNCSECLNTVEVDGEDILIYKVNKSDDQSQEIYYCQNVPSSCLDTITQNDILTCIDCSNENQLLNKYCCEEGFQYQSGQCIPSDVVACEDGLYRYGQQCIQLPVNCLNGFQNDQQFECITCKDNYYKTNQRCCLQDYYYDTQVQKCISINTKLIQDSQFCKVYDIQPIDNILYCNECQDGYYKVNVVTIENNLFIEQRKSTCCTIGQSFNYQTQLCESIEKFSRFFSEGLTITDCNKMNVFIQDDTSYIYCSECIQQNHQVQIAYPEAQFILKSGTITCSSVDTSIQCSAKITNSSNNESNCLKCFDYENYYLGNKSCCKIGKATVDSTPRIYVEIEQQNGICQEDQSSNCQYFDRTQSCQKCIDNYYLDGNECKQIFNSLNLDQCQVSYDNQCLRCNKGYYLDSNQACQQLTSTNQPQMNCSGDQNQNCIYCYDNQVLTNGACCDLGHIFLQYIQTCVDIQNLLDHKICLQQSNSECIKCNNSLAFYTIQDTNNKKQCCSKNNILIDQVCTSTPNSNTKLADCNVYLNSNTCRQLTDEEKTLGTLQDDCKNSKQIVNGSCCEQNQYFDGIQCDDITNINDTYSLCAQIDDNKNCTKCKLDTQYITNYRCCEQNQYFDGVQCDDITKIDDTYSLCVQIDDNKNCTKCKLDTQYVTNNRCCVDGQIFDGTQCSIFIVNCQEIENGLCTLCEDTYYLSDGKCCNDEQVYTNNECQTLITQFPTQINCIQIADPTATNIVCSQCSSGNILSNGYCCNTDQIYDTNKSKCIDVSYLNNCANLNGDLTCSICKENFYLTNKQCCENKKYFDSDGNQCTNISDQKCLQINNNNSCIKCDTNHYLNPVISDKLCCINQMPPNSTNCQTLDTNNSIEGCTNFNSSSKCIQCSDQYTFQKNICCPIEHVLLGNDSTLDKCIAITDLYSNCLSFDTLTLKCTQCVANFYILNDWYFCCDNKKHFDSSTNECINNHSNCIKQDDENCTLCDDNYYLVGTAGSKQCCAIGNYFDTTLSTPICKSIPSINNCEKANLNQSDKVICLQCADNYILDEVNNQCLDKLDNCQEHNFDTNNDLQCTQCNNQYLLSSDTTICCSMNNFYIEDGTSKCSTTIDIKDINCETIDTNTYICKSCGSQSYLMGDICCDNGKFKKDTDIYECTGVIQDEYNVSNCNQYGTNQCKVCKDGYQKNASGLCLQIPDDCSIFDLDQGQCLQCIDNYYVNSNQCCPEGQQYISEACKTPDTPILNCLQYADNEQNKCKKCSNGYYNINKEFCCEDTKYCQTLDSQLEGQINNCKEYNTNINDCSVCSRGYSIVQILYEENGNNIKYCLNYQIQDCQISNLSTLNATKLFTCDQCIDGKQLNNIDDVIETYTIEDNVNNCSIYDIKQKLDILSFKCSSCEDDYYLNDSNQCIERTINYFNCLKKDPRKDECKTCDIRFKLNNGLCIEYSMSNCNKAFNQNNCQECDNTYLQIGSTQVDQLEDYQCILESSFIDQSQIAIPNKSEFVKHDRCIEHTQCTNFYLNGLNPEISKYLSCHICNDSNRIPFIFLKLDYETQKGNQIDQGIYIHNDLKDTSTNKNSECFLTDLSEFQLEVSNFIFPSNCGVGAINGKEPLSLNQTDQSNIDISQNKLSIFCVACKPGFKPSYSNLNYHIYQCIKIDNCNNSGSAFNQCDECDSGYAFEYIEDNELSKDNCIDVPLPQMNCYAYDQTNQECKVCQIGYNFNIEGICELLEIPKCILGKNNKNDIWNTTDLRLAYYKGIKGCQECQDDYFKFKKEIDDYVCLESPYKLANNYIEGKSFLELNCKYYQRLDDITQCMMCEDGYLIDVNGQCLIYNDNFINCKIVQDLNNCNECNEHYKLNENNICLIQFIQGCKIYTNNLSCQECFYGLNRKQNIEGNYYCDQPLELYRCLNYSQSHFLEGNLTCTQCMNDYQLKIFEDIQDICIPLLYVEGCINYDDVNSLDEIPNCLKCNQNYYLVNYSCVKRIHKNENCEEYSIDSDQCTQCLDGYYLIEDGKKCQESLEYIRGCQLYRESGECQVCEIGRYLIDDICEIIPLDNLIEKQCQKCKQNFFLYQNRCYRQDLDSCKVYETPEQCRECEVGYKIKIKHQKNVCRRVQQIQNCQEMQIDSPYSCQSCQSDFYFTIQGKCCKGISIQNRIQNCIQYDANQECIRCQKDFYLTQDRSRCIELDQTIDCLDLQETQDLTCSQCKKGYRLTDQNLCEEDNTYITGCLIPNRDDISQCDICEPNYYIDNDKLCRETNP